MTRFVGILTVFVQHGGLWRLDSNLGPLDKESWAVPVGHGSSIFHSVITGISWDTPLTNSFISLFIVSGGKIEGASKPAFGCQVTIQVINIPLV